MRVNIPNMHNNIIDISSFQTGLNVLFSSTGFYFKSKRSDIFFSPSGCPDNSIFQKQYIFIRSTFLMKHFFSYYQNAYGHEMFRMVTSCEELSPINMHDISTE